MDNKLKVVLQRFWFWAFLAIGLVLVFATMSGSPIHWQDEVQINEIGRKILHHGNPEWDMKAKMDSSGGDFGYSLWGAAVWLHEVAYLAIGHIGPRVVTEIFLLVAVLLFRSYAISATANRFYSELLSLLFFSFPLLHVGRAEPYVFCALFLSLFLIRKNCLGKDYSMIAAGSFSIFCLFTWPTAIVLMPIIGNELVNRLETNVYSCRRKVRDVILFSLGAILWAFLIMFPFLCDIKGMLLLISNSSSRSAKIGSGFFLDVFLKHFLVLPYHYILGVGCLFVCYRKWLLIIGGLLFLGMCTISRVYEFRLIYFLPYVLVGAIYAYTSISLPRYKRFLILITAIIAIIMFERGLVRRRVIDLLGSDLHDNSILELAFKGHIPEGAKVYSHTFNTYYVGRKLGWKQYQLDFQDNTLGAQYLADMEYFVVEERSMNETLKYLLEESGFIQYRRIEYPLIHLGEFSRHFNMLGKLKIWGPWLIYKNQLQR